MATVDFVPEGLTAEEWKQMVRYKPKEMSENEFARTVTKRRERSQRQEELVRDIRADMELARTSAIHLVKLLDSVTSDRPLGRGLRARKYSNQLLEAVSEMQEFVGEVTRRESDLHVE